MRTVNIAWVVLAAAFALSGCETPSCNAIAYRPRVELRIVDPSRTAASYEVELSYDRDGTEVVVTCSGGDFPGAQRDGGPEEDDAGTPSERPAFSCESSLPDAVSAFVSFDVDIEVSLTDTPPELHVVVRDRTGEIVLERDLSIEYTTEYPSGPECGGVEIGKTERLFLP